MNNTGIRRRAFLAAGAAGAAHAAQNAPPASVQPNAPPAGEPYDLPGRRLVFLNWHYIRPGSFEWRDANGNAVGLRSAVPPDAAHMVRTDQPYGIRLAAQPAQRMGPLIEPEAPWEEGAGVHLTTVLKDGGMFRGWGIPYTFSGDPPGQKHSYYLESSDGITWKRPNLGIVEFNGSRDNNLVNIFATDGGTVFIDESAPPAERYKLIAEGHFPREAVTEYLRRRPKDWDPKVRWADDGGAKGMKGGVSPDGLHWTLFPQPMAMEMTDTHLTGYYDPWLKKYVAYTRTWSTGERSSRVRGETRAMRKDLAVRADYWWQVGRRSIGRSETANFREFPLHETILEPGPDLLPTDTLYTNGRTTFPGAPSHHLMFPTIWHTTSDSTSIAIASSHDGKIWHFLPGSPIFGTGPFGAFDGGCVFAHPNLVELSGGRLVMPYSGYSVPHKYPRKLWKFGAGYMVWEKSRLVALEARERGEFATVGLMPPGRKLRINALTRRGGSVQVEVADIFGQPLPGRTFAEARRVSGDHHWTPLSWKGSDDLGFNEGEAIILRFRLDQAQLFGLEFA